MMAKILNRNAEEFISIKPNFCELKNAPIIILEKPATKNVIGIIMQ